MSCQCSVRALPSFPAATDVVPGMIEQGDGPFWRVAMDETLEKIICLSCLSVVPSKLGDAKWCLGRKHGCSERL
jgi:hypothetical protein